jgi:peptide/nickel transport system permease protein
MTFMRDRNRRSARPTPEPSDPELLHPAPIAGAGEAEAIRRHDGFFVRFRYVLKTDRLGQIAVAYLAILLLAAIIGPTLVGHAATEAHLSWRFTPPLDTGHGYMYVLGSDALGRSFLARLIVAARTTLVISVLAVLAAALIGTLVGTAVGYVGGRLDSFAMRSADVMMAFPSLLLALIVLYTLGPSLPALIFVLAATRIPLYARVARAETLAVRERLFIDAARALGASSLRIVFRQILPVIAASLVTLATLEFALVILSESALSFLGLGVRDPSFTWGSMISEGRNYLRDAWWVAILPGLAITATAISANVLADTVRRAQDSE